MVARMIGWAVAGTLALSPVPAAAAAWTWFPPGPAAPRAVADPLEPRTGLTAALDQSRFDGALGLPLPLLGAQAADWSACWTLEAGAVFTLGRDGSFFPLETFDGILGLGFEGARGPWSARLRFLHRSAHKADGDSTVAFRGHTFSREHAALDLFWNRGPATAYGRIAASWHAVPEDDPPALAGGLIWTLGRPFPWMAAVHLAADRERGFRLDKSLVLGALLGASPRMLLGLRLSQGLDHRGQYAGRRIRSLGLELQYAPGGMNSFPRVIGKSVK